MHRFPVRRLSSATAILCLAALAHAEQPPTPAAALETVSAASMLENINTLASDRFGGRGPGTQGEELTIAFLQDAFKRYGLEPGNPDGTYLQEVPLVGITANKDMKLELTGAGSSLHAEYGTEFVAWTKRVVKEVDIDAELVFVGYGVQAPEFEWDDFKGVDVKGKAIVVLINDPPVADEHVFGGKGMTYYGRWTYKFEKAAELGAAACFIVHVTERAGYPWAVVQSSWTGEQFDLSSADKNMGRAAVESWISTEFATALFAAAGKDLGELTKAAAQADFKPVPLGISVRMKLENVFRDVKSHNVVAKLTGSDPRLRDELVVYSAHWDHLGTAEGKEGDNIYNGAVDNASGTAALLEIAKAFRALPVPPKRSVLFLSVTAEERGILGSRYYAENPLYPLSSTAAAINMDGMTVLGKTRDLVSLGAGSSTLDEVVLDALHEQGRVLVPDPEPEKGYFYRSDHFEFAKRGVPAFYPSSGVDYVGKPEGWGMQMRARYTAEDYHKPTDEVKADWDLSGAVENTRLYILVGWHVANESKMPEWKPGAEFRSIREKSLEASQAKSP